MKISLFYKPYIIKVSSFFIITLLISITPLIADANVFDWITGGQVQAEETTSLNDNNIQTMSLSVSEPSINPDLKNTSEKESVLIGQEGSYIESDGSFGTDVNLNLEKSPLSDQIMIYTVKKGDTLSEIAESFDVSMNTIRWENNISGQTISIGQKLNILPVTGVKHIVKSGDTIGKIADKYEADIEDVLIFNGISKGDALKAGDIIFVPNGIIKSIISTPTSSSGSSKITVSNTKVQSGYYMRPVPGRITSPYGSRKGGFHPGVDLAGVKGVTPVEAAASGLVVKVISGCREGVKSCGGRYGNYIVISHPNGTETTYAHLNKTLVKIGQIVSQGQQIGIIGNTGYSTGPHLHFEIENANGSKMKPPF